MNKRKLHHTWVRFRDIGFLIPAVCAVVFGATAVYSLRQNNLTAVHLRDELLQVDKDNGDVEAALRNLRTYTYSHMHTNLASESSAYPPIQLKYRYDRLVQAEIDRVSGNGNTVYNDAQKYCEQTEPQSFYGAGRLGCIQRYIDSHPTTQEVIKPIPDSLYKFDFVSPVWSPDLAGWSLVLCGVSLMFLAVRLGIDIWFRYQFKHHE